MAPATPVADLAERINRAASDYHVGALQQLRWRLRGRRPKTKKIFSKITVFEEKEYAYHHGGRMELQFNIGMEQHDQRGFWRHGVAFSFERNINLPEPGLLRPKVSRFNVWVRSNADALRGFRMWDWARQTRSTDRSPGEILEASISGEAFVFLGTMSPAADVDPRRILQDFDRLLPLYEYVETVSGTQEQTPSQQSPGHGASPVTHTTASRLAAVIEVDLRHNLLQESLIRILQAEFPGCPVHPEWAGVAASGRVDVAVETSDGLLFCEIKVAPHVRAAVREAIGQLLEYAHWPDETRARKWGWSPRGLHRTKMSHT
jgi:hypothetical protein